MKTNHNFKANFYRIAFMPVRFFCFFITSSIVSIILVMSSTTHAQENEDIASADLKSFDRPYCTTNTEGIILPNTDLIMIDKKTQERFDALLNELMQLGSKLLKTREKLFTTANVATDRKEFEQLKVEYNRLNTPLNDIIEALPNTHRQALVNLLKTYFTIIEVMVQIETMLNPYESSISKMLEQFNISLKFDHYFKIYPIGTTHPANIAIIDSRNNVYKLALTKSEVYKHLVRAAAQSRVTKQNNTQYLDTVLCGLNRMVIGKLKLNQALIQKVDENLPIGRAHKTCLATTAQEFIDMTIEDISARSEGLLRGQVSEVLPQFFSDLSEEHMKFYAESGVSSFIPELFIFPDSLIMANQFLNAESLPSIKLAQLTNFTSAAQVSIEKTYKKNPFLEPLRHVWQRPEMKEILRNIFSTCKFKPVSNLKTLSTDELLSKIDLSEDVYFIKNLRFQLDSLNQKLGHASEEELKRIFKQYVISSKEKAIYEALSLSLSHFSEANISPPIVPIMTIIRKDIEQVIENLFSQTAINRELDVFFSELVRVVQINKDDSLNFKSLLISFTQEMIAGAKQIALFLDPKTPSDQLPYDIKPNVRALSIYFDLFTPFYQSRFDNLVKVENFELQKKIFNQIKNDLYSEASKLKIDCAQQKKPKSGISRTIRSWMLNDRPDTNSETVSRQCFYLKIVANALSLEKPQEHKNGQDLFASIAAHLDEDEKNVFQDRYRNELASDIFGQFRLLDMDLERTKPWPLGEIPKFYTLLAKYDEHTKNENELPLDLVRKAVERSIGTLKKHLINLSNTKKVTDLDFFIKRTKVINYFIGDDPTTFAKYLNGFNGQDLIETPTPTLTDIMMSAGFVFPNLIDYHKRLQGELVERENIETEIFDELISNNVKLSMWVIGGWAAKHAIGVLPSWSQLPRLSSSLQLASRNMSPMIGAHSNYFLGLLMYQIADYTKQAISYHSELRKIGELNSAETLTPEGAENPLSLISWEDFRSQRILFDNKIRNSYMGIAQSFGWLAFPLILNKGFQKAGSLMNGIRVRWAARAQNLTPQKLKSFEAYQRMIINMKIKKLGYAFGHLKMKNPYSLDIEELYRNMNLAKSSTTSTSKKFEIQQSYEDILRTFGPDIDKIAQHVSLQQTYARALFGPNGTVEQLARFHSEYKRIVGGY